MSIRFVGKARDLAKKHGWKEPKKVTHDDYMRRMGELQAELSQGKMTPEKSQRILNEVAALVAARSQK